MHNRITALSEQLNEDELDLIAMQVICRSSLHASKDVNLKIETMYERYSELQRKKLWDSLSQDEEGELQKISPDAKKEEDRILAEKRLADKHSDDFLQIKENLRKAWDFHYTGEYKREGDTAYAIHKRVANYVMGIDLTKSVEIFDIPIGTLLGQYRAHDRQGDEFAGRWFSLIKKSDGRTAVRPHTEYGISSMSPSDILIAWKERNKKPTKHLFVYQTTSPIKGLKTFASAIADTFSHAVGGEAGRVATQGTAVQVFVPSGIKNMVRNKEQEEIVNKEIQSVPRIISWLRKNVERAKKSRDEKIDNTDSDISKAQASDSDNDSDQSIKESKPEISSSDSDSDNDSDKNVKMDEVKLDKSIKKLPKTKDEWTIDTLRELVEKIIVMEGFYAQEGDKVHAQDLKDLVALAKGLLSSAEARKENIEPHFEALVLILRHEFDQLQQKKLREESIITTDNYMKFLNKNKSSTFSFGGHHHYARMIGLALQDVYLHHPDIYKNHPGAEKKYPSEPFKILEADEDYTKYQAQERNKKLAEASPKILFGHNNAQMFFHGFYNKKTHDIIVAPISAAAFKNKDFSSRDVTAEMMQLNKSDFLHFDLLPNAHSSFDLDWQPTDVTTSNRFSSEEIIQIREKILSWGPIQPLEKIKAKQVIQFLTDYFNDFNQGGTQPFKGKFSISLDEKEKIFKFQFTQRPYSSDDKKLMRKLLFDVMHVQPKHGFSLFNKDSIYTNDFFEQNGYKSEHGSPEFTLPMEKLTLNKDFMAFMDKQTKSEEYSPHK